MKNKLLYFGLLVVTLYLAILYDSPMLLGFGLMEMILPVISGILMLWTAAHMKAQIYLPIGVAEKEQLVNVGVRIENKSRIPVSRLEAKIKIQNRFYQPEKEVIFQGMADGRGTTRLTTAITQQSVRVGCVMGGTGKNMGSVSSVRKKDRDRWKRGAFSTSGVL